MTTTKHDPWFGRPVRFAGVAGEGEAPPDDAPHVPGPYDIGARWRAVAVIETALPAHEGCMLWRPSHRWWGLQGMRRHRPWDGSSPTGLLEVS